jgi:hypothetical protein
MERQRRVVILPRRLERSVAMAQRDDVGQLRLTLPRSMMAMRSGNTPFSLLARQQEPFYRTALSRKNQWSWGGSTTRNLKRCRLIAGMVALFFSWWNLFVRLAESNHHRQADHQPTIAASGHRQANPPCRPHQRDDHQQPRRASPRPKRR